MVHIQVVFKAQRFRIAKVVRPYNACYNPAFLLFGREAAYYAVKPIRVKPFFRFGIAVEGIGFVRFWLGPLYRLAFEVTWIE